MKCSKCDKNEALPLHICPFQADIWNDEEFECDCCEECEDECAADI